MSGQDEERQALLSHLMRGILHELANPLNTILMNAELAAMTAGSDAANDELAQILSTVAAEARRGGDLVRGLSRFASSENSTPTGVADPARAITLGQRLVGSQVRAKGAALRLAMTQSLPSLPLDELALAFAVAQAIELQLERGARTLAIDAGMRGDMIEIRILADDLDADTPALKLPALAQSILADHGGGFECAGSTCVLLVATAARAAG